MPVNINYKRVFIDLMFLAFRFHCFVFRFCFGVRMPPRTILFGLSELLGRAFVLFLIDKMRRSSDGVLIDYLLFLFVLQTYHLKWLRCCLSQSLRISCLCGILCNRRKRSNLSFENASARFEAAPPVRLLTWRGSGAARGFNASTHQPQ